MSKRNPQTTQLAEVLQYLGEWLRVPREAAEVHQVLVALEDSTDPLAADELGLLVLAGRELEMRLAASQLTPRDVWALVTDGIPVLLSLEDGSWLLVKQKIAWRMDSVHLRMEDRKCITEPLQLTLGRLKRYWQGQSRLGAILAQGTQAGVSSAPLSELGSDPRSHGHGHGAEHAGHGHHHESIPPVRRLARILRLELRDISTLTLFAVVAGVLGLATPLAVESLVNTVAWGTYLQPLFILSTILFGFLAFAGLLKLLQQIIVEVMQRRLFVRIVGDLAHRFPMANQNALAGEYPRELANRYFDIMTIQKATASMLLDGISIVLQTTTGLILLAFYHPFLLGFDIILLVLMTVVTYILGRGGVKSAIAESITKYELAHWLQDVIACPTAFRLHGGTQYAVERANRLTVRYLTGRQAHFRVLIRQSAFSLLLLAVASTALLGVGGWLVIRGELTLGQLVASELVVTAIVGAFAKIGKSLETYYDLCAAVGKVGHLLDIPYDAPALDMETCNATANIRWQNLPIHIAGQNPAEMVEIAAGSRVAITGPSGSGKTRLMSILAGMNQTTEGFAELAGYDALDASRVADGNLVSYARQPEIFAGTVLENVRLGRSWLSSGDVRRALERVGLWEDVLSLPGGIDAELQTGGFPLTYSQTVRLTLARALATVPSILLIDGVLDLLDPGERWKIWQELAHSRDLATIVIATHDPHLVGSCDRVFVCEGQLEHAHGSEDGHHG